MWGSPVTCFQPVEFDKGVGCHFHDYINAIITSTLLRCSLLCSIKTAQMGGAHGRELPASPETGPPPTPDGLAGDPAEPGPDSRPAGPGGL